MDRVRDVSSVDRRAFLRSVTIAAAAAPVILTTTAGSAQVPCSAPSSRPELCPCTDFDDCTPPAECINHGALGTWCCIPSGQPPRGGTCVGENGANTCCFGLCDPNTDLCGAPTG